MTAQLALAAPAAAGAERPLTACGRNGADRPEAFAVASAAPTVVGGTRTPLEALEAEYVRLLADACRARTDDQVRERFDAADRAMARLQREARSLNGSTNGGDN